MCTTNFNVWTYNTHLFGDAIGVLSGQRYEDSDRKHSIIEYFQGKPSGPTLITFEEVWDAGFAGDFAHDLDTHGGYTHFINDVHALEILNKSGVAMFGGPNMAFSDMQYFDYITNCNKDGWSGQDIPALKGFLSVLCQYTCSENHQHQLGLFGTHMPTNYGTYTKSVTCCFSSLSNAIGNLKSKYPSAGIVVMGDMNIAGDTVNDEYTATVENILLANNGLQNSAPPGSSAGYSINSSTNTFWQYFNQGKPAKQDRIDYVLYADSNDGTTTISLSSVEVSTDSAFTIPGTAPYSPLTDSDHYPVNAVLEITASDPASA